MKMYKKTILGILLTGVLTLTGSTALIAGSPPDDKSISQAVETELLFNGTTPAYMIDVVTTEGIVTLSGQVNDILARDRAIQIAKTVKGVRGVVDQIEVNVPYRSDATLEKEVKEALLRDPATDSYEGNVTANNGIITLTGNVDSWQEKKLFEFVTKGVKGVAGVENDLKVVYHEERSDYEIRTDIEQTLKNDIRVDDALIDVTVKNGNVELSGSVSSANEKSTASALAWTSGVKSVSSDDLTIKEWARNDNFRENKYVTKTDAAVKKAVEDAFLYDPRVYSFNPEVSVENGVVTLSGVVDNLKAKRAATRDAKNVVGVYRVKNFMKVRPVFIPEDSELEADIANALLEDPVVEKWEVDVTAKNGVIYLNGSVDSYFEKIQAEDIASRTRGVIAVENNLSINDPNDVYFYDYYGWNSYYPPFHVEVDNIYKTDEQIESDIESQIWWSPYVNQEDVDVSVSNGIATLEGVVDTPRERIYDEINALEGGASDVNNNLIVDLSK